MEAAISRVESATQEEQEDTPENEARRDSIAGKKAALEFTLRALTFINSLSSSSDKLLTLLSSSTVSDVTSALRFYSLARGYKLECAVSGMRKALSLMWSADKGVQDEVLKAFEEVFIKAPGGGDLPARQVAHNLIVLVGESNVSERASIEAAVGHLVREGTIPEEVFLTLWSRAAKSTGPARAASLRLVGMVGGEDREVLDSTSRLRCLCEAGFGDTADWEGARAAAVAVSNLGRVEDETEEGSPKNLVARDIIDGLKRVVRADWVRTNPAHAELDTRAWFGAAEDSINALFSIAGQPEKHAAQIVKLLAEATFGEDEVDPLVLARFFFVLGHVAIRSLLYAEKLTKEVKKGNATKTVVNQEKADEKKRNRGAKEGGDDDAIEDELGVAQQVEADTDRLMADISENEIVGRGLLGVFGPLLVQVVANEDRAFSHILLRQASTLALSKFCCISDAFCTKNLPLLLTTLDNDESEVRISSLLHPPPRIPSPHLSPLCRTPH